MGGLKYWMVHVCFITKVGLHVKTKKKTESIIIIIFYVHTMYNRWGLILINTIQYLSVNFGGIGLAQGVPGLYEKVRKEVLVFQTLAILEVPNTSHMILTWYKPHPKIIHCITGIVRSSVLTTVMQVYSRLFILWGVIEAVHGVSTDNESKNKSYFPST